MTVLVEPAELARALGSDQPAGGRGLGDATLYPGSWSGWISDPVRPVSTAANPTAGDRRT